MSTSHQIIIIVLIAAFFYAPTFANPTVHYGTAPLWVTNVKNNETSNSSRDISDGIYLKLFEKESNISTDETYEHIIEDIVSDAGVQNGSNISITFNPAYERLTVHNITIIRDGKRINKLQKDAFKIIAEEKELSMFVYNGEYSAFIILPDIRKGDKIEYDYTVAGSNPIFNGKFSTDFEFHRLYPVAQIHYSILLPANRRLFFKYFNNASKPEERNIGNNKLYNWDLLNVKPYEYEDYMPEWLDPFPHVQISEYNGWHDVGEWAYKINMPNKQLDGALNTRLSALSSNYRNDTPQLFRSIVSIVQNEVRYMGIELGAYSHKANDPCKVYNQRYGDCKDKSLLLVSMLQHVGIRADMALVSTSSKWTIADDLPFPFSFNHAVAVAHISGKDVWIDPTIAFQGGAGTDIYFPYYGKALVLKPGVDSLSTIPETNSGYVKYTEEYRITDVYSPVTLVIYTTYYGHRADEMRYNLVTESKTDIEKSYLDYYGKIFTSIKSADTLTVKDDIITDTLETIERYSIKGFYEYDSAGNNYSAELYSYMVRDKLPKAENDNQYPISVSYPYKMHCTTRVYTQNGWDIKPISERIFRDAYHFSYDVSASDNILSLDYELVFMKDHITPENTAQYKTDRKKIDNEYLSYTITHDLPSTTKSKNSTVNNIDKITRVLFSVLIIGLLAYRLWKRLSIKKG